MRSGQKRRFRPGFDRLDGRCLPTAGVTASLAHGVLTVDGTEAADTIAITIRAVNPPAAANSTGWGAVVVAGLGRFRLSQTQAIAVHGGAGDDTITVDDGGWARQPVWIDGGPGNDTIQGGSGDDVLLGGTGNDQIDSGGGEDWIDGESGLDTINGVQEQQTTRTPRSDPLPVNSSATTSSSNNNPAKPEADIASAIVALANRERQSAGLAPLRVNDQLTQAAQIQAEAMANLGQLDHTLPGAKFPTLQDRAQHVGYQYKSMAENIAYNFDDAESAMTAWMASPGHRANLLNPDLQETGVGVAANALGRLYFCQDFGQPV